MSNKKPSGAGFRVVWATVGVCLALCAAGAWWVWSAAPPQLGGDEQVFDTVDALFTAVRARDPRLLDDCEQRLRTYEKDGKLSAPAVSYLDEIIEMARAGKWRPAAEKLYEFMKAQRRA
ncbi:MAG TPA: hypothetical protein VNH11_30970 [Pirellulales bacterium]|nr:hypothetical protein [Pirellulales bacterium]